MACAVSQLLSGTHSGREKRRLVQVNWRLIYLTCSCYMSIGFPQMADLQLISHHSEKEWRDELPDWILDLSAFPCRWAHRQAQPGQSQGHSQFQVAAL